MSITHPKTDANGRPFSLDLSPAFGFADEVVDPGDRHFILPINTILAELDQRRDYDGIWAVTDNVGHRLDHSGSARPYRRAISADPGLYARMRAYALGQDQSYLGKPPQPSTVDRLTTARAEVARLEAEVKAESEIKVGDWVVAIGSFRDELTKDRLYRVNRNDFSIGIEKDDRGSAANGWPASKWRKATPVEIDAHLKSLRVEVAGEGGKLYQAVPRSSYVQFGCAYIANGDLRDAHAFLTSRPKWSGPVNRAAKAVQLGAGLFTLDILTRLLPQLTD